MRFFLFLIIFIFASKLIADDVTIIELHNKENIDQGLISATKEKTETNNENNNISLEEKEIEIEGTIIESENNNENINVQEISTNENEIISLPDPWEKSNKDDLNFLFENTNLTSSDILNGILISYLESESKLPDNFSKDEFNHIKINKLIKLGQSEKAFQLINIIENENNINFYNLFKLNYFFSKYEILEACDFNNSIERKNTNIDQNFLLKVDIFCTYINNELEEANFLNSLLIDANDEDSYFQELYWKLQNSNKNEIDINSYKYSFDSMPLYSAMIRVGDIPLDEMFLEHDSSNLAIPIILSQSSDITLRLKAAHQAYKNNIFNSESLAALYQTVDFSYDQLSNSVLKFNNLEMQMSYLFQKANIQLLPITRLETLINFWFYAEENQLNLLAYDISRNLIESIEPSAELHEYGIEIAKAHIYNNNFDLANKWILFTENYISTDSTLESKIQSVKLLYNLKNPLNESNFNDILIQSELFSQEYNDSFKQDILLTILSVIDENNDLSFVENKNFFDQRPMPSRYLLDKINYASEISSAGEILLYINISIQDKKWFEIHPAHLKVVLKSFKEYFSEDLFNNLIVEILQESKII